MDQTIAQLIGQMLMVGWQTPDAEDIVEDIKRYRFGNVILFSRNIRSAQHLRDLCGRIQETCIQCNGAPAFISVDQEGGGACRIFDGMTPVSGNMAVAAATAKHRNAASRVGHIVGSELKSLGVNLNLAPVSDINTNPYNPIIGVRSYSDNPAFVSQLASDYAQGLQSEGVMACYKHFLGHGDVDVDSRLDLPRVRKSSAELELCELVPYKAERIADAIMAAHILYTDLDDQFPASISERILKGLLREKIGYQGLILTDCFEMAGLERTFSLGEAAIFAANASVDIIPVSHRLGRQLAVRGALLNAIREGVVPMETILQANARIATFKSKYTLPFAGAVDRETNRRVSEKIADASIAVLSGKPFEIDRETVAVGVTGVAAIGVTGTASPDTEHLYGKELDVAARIGEEFGIAYRSIDNKNFNVGEVLEFAKGRKVVLCLSDSHLTLIQKVLFSSLLQTGARVMLVSMRTPYDALGQEPPECHIAAFEYSELSIRALLNMLRLGAASGVSPVRLDRKSAPDRTDESRNFLIENVVAYIRENFAKRLTLDNVAEEFFISGGHLCKLVKKKLNKNFIDVVNEIRVNEAKKMLSTTTMRIYEIASNCGFSDINYFTKTFKRYSGVTPTYYRNHYQSFD